MTQVLDPKLNFAVVTPSTGYASGATSVVLTAGHGSRLPAPASDGAFNLVWWNSTDYATPSEDPYVEVVRVTARSSDTLTVTRAQESTTATAKNLSGKTYSMVLGLTAKDWTDLDTALDTVTDEVRELLTAGGTANALTATPGYAWTAYTTGRGITVNPASANTGSATLAVSGLTAKTIKSRAGANLQAGDLRAGVPVKLVYDGTNFIMMSPDVDNRQVAKAWVMFDASSGTPTIRQSFNVTSITDNGVGDFTINFTTAFADAYYAVAGCGYDQAGSWSVSPYERSSTARTASLCRFLYFQDGSAARDPTAAGLIFYGAR